MRILAYSHLDKYGVSCRCNVCDIIAMFLKSEIYLFPGICRLHMVIVDTVTDPQTYLIDKLNNRTIMFLLERMR